ncbi:MAG: hypothetical protein QM690_06680 [Sphingobium sp.]
MTRYLIVLAAAAAATGSLMSVSARTVENPEPAIISKTADGKPLLLGRMVVTAAPLADSGS